MENSRSSTKKTKQGNAVKPRDRDRSTSQETMIPDEFKGLEKELIKAMIDSATRCNVDIEKPEEHCFKITLELWSDTF